MDTTYPDNAHDIYVERLQQARRVMQGLSKQERNNFDINMVATNCEQGFVGCIAGFCGRDPWFQERGFISDVQKNRISMRIDDFFGIDGPFFEWRGYYPSSCIRPVTVDDAISALNRAIDSLEDGVTPKQNPPERSDKELSSPTKNQDSSAQGELLIA